MTTSGSTSSAESIVVSLDKAKRLKEAGWPQSDSSFIWCWCHEAKEPLLLYKTSHTDVFETDVAAPTAEEILRRLPITNVPCRLCVPSGHYCHNECDCKCHTRQPREIGKWKHWRAMKDGNQYCVLYGNNLQDGHGEFSDTLANAAAAMYCYLAKNKLLPAG